MQKDSIQLNGSTTNSYDETANLFTMFDALKPGVTISKQSINGTDELDGAELKLIAPNGADLSQVSGSYSDGSAAKIKVVGNTITWTSNAEKGGVTLANLPAGTYTLEEITAPDGFTKKTEEMTFTVDAHGNVKKPVGLEEGESGNTLIMKDAPSTVSIVKVGKDGDASQELPGAKMKLTYAGDADLSQVTEEHDAITGNKPGSKEITWTSGDQAIVLKQIPDGKYTLQETTSPSGYELTTEITFEVKDGVVQKDSIQLNESTTNSYDETANRFTMFDAMKPGVTISKQSINGTDELNGAKLKLTAPDGTDLSQVSGSYSDGSAAKIKVVGNTITWTSNAEKGGVTLANLPAGTYTLEEITAPDGFTKKTEEMTFTVDAHGNVKKPVGLEEGESGNTLIMKDAPSTVSIVKVGKDGDASQELPGAKMKLTYAGDADLSQVTEEHDVITGNVPGSKEITWTSGDQAIVLKQIPDGKYTLQETQAPNGYELTTEITFEVKDGVVQKDSIQLNGSTTNSYDETANLFTMFDAMKQVTTTSTSATTTSTSTTTTPTRTSATTGSSTETTVSTTSATPTDTTTSTTVSTTKTTVASTDTTTGSSTVTTVSTTASTAGPTQPTTTSTTGSGTVTTVSTTASTAGPTQPTTTSTTGSGTVTTVSTTASTAGPTQPTTTSATATNTTTTTSSTGTGSDTGTTTTTQSATTVTATNTGSVTETTPIVTETAPVATTTCSTIQTTETTPTTVTTVTTPVTTVTTTELERGVLIRKCDMGGNEIAGASLQVADLDGNVIDAWISEAGISHAIETVEVGVPYCLTELQAPVDYALAESIYFRLEEDGTVTILTFAVNEDGTIATDENGPIILTETPSADAVVTMFDEFIGIVTTTDITTETTTTTETETTTTTPHNTTNDNGNHTPSASETTSSGETTTETTNGSGTTTTDGSGTTTTTRYRSSSGSSSSSSSGRGSSSVRVSSTPKTDDRIWMLLFPTGLALTGAILTGRKRKKKHQK